MELDVLEKQVFNAVKELVELATLQNGHILVMGCSTSEVQGKKIGSRSNNEVAEAIIHGALRALKGTGIHLAVQCCEHLNRALVIDRKVAQRHCFEPVTVLPVPQAGGAAASYAMEAIEDSVVVEKISADAGLDIGDTFIGMHLKPVAVPLRLTLKSVGDAHLTAVGCRPKLIGGERAVYPKSHIKKS